MAESSILDQTAKKHGVTLVDLTTSKHLTVYNEALTNMSRLLLVSDLRKTKESTINVLARDIARVIDGIYAAKERRLIRPPFAKAILSNLQLSQRELLTAEQLLQRYASNERSTEASSTLYSSLMECQKYISEASQYLYREISDGN